MRKYLGWYMNKRKKLTIAIILTLFICFALFYIYNSNSYDVLEVRSPQEVVVDKNKNGQIDDNEVVTLLDGYTVIPKEDNDDDTVHARACSFW